MEIEEWMEQPYQQQQANAGEGGGEDGAGGGGEGDGGEGGGGEETVDLDAALSEAIDAGIEEADGPVEKPGAEEEEDAGDGAAAAAEGDGKPGEAKKPDAADDKDGDGKKKDEPDHVNDPIPDEVKGRTRERMESLVSKVKETSTQLEQVQGQYDSMMGMIAETKATPEQYGMVLEYLGAVNSDDPESIRGAMKTLQTELDALAERLGETAPGKDPLDGHQDLQDAVEVGDITKQHAEELAQARNQRAAAQRRQQQGQQQQQQQTEQQRARADGKQALTDLETELKKNDPQYMQKRAVLIDMLKPVMAQIHPSKWAATFKAAYEKLPAPQQQQPGDGGQGKGDGHQPLRARQPAGGQQKAPGSLEEAIDLGIEQAGR